MAAELWDPWFLISEESGQEKYSGIMPKILEYLQVSLNFTTTLVRPPDGAWGAVDENGNWGGMVGMVNRNEVDFALGEQIIMYRYIVYDTMITNCCHFFRSFFTHLYQVPSC